MIGHPGEALEAIVWDYFFNFKHGDTFLELNPKW